MAKVFIALRQRKLTEELDKLFPRLSAHTTYKAAARWAAEKAAEKRGLAYDVLETTLLQPPKGRPAKVTKATAPSSPKRSPRRHAQPKSAEPAVASG